MKPVLRILATLCILACTAASALAQTPVVTTLEYPKEKTTAIHFTHNSRHVVFGTEKGTVVRSTLPQARDANQIAKHEEEVTAIASTVDGAFIITASKDQVVKIWEAANNTVSTLNVGLAKGSYPTLLAVSPDGKFFVTTNANGARVWDIGTKGVLATIGYSAPKDVKITPDSKQILLSGFGMDPVAIFDAATGKSVDVIRAEGKSGVAPITTFDISYDGRYLATAGGPDKILRVWSLQSRKEIVAKPMEKDPITLVRFTNDGQYIVTASEDKKVKVWNASDLNLKLSLHEYDARIEQMALTNDGKLFTASTGSEKNVIKDLSWLELKPWKPADITPPAIAMISPRMNKERGIKNLAYSNQQRVRVQCKVNDLSGVKTVLINGKPAQRSLAAADRYESEEVMYLEDNAENKISVTAVDSLGNTSTLDLKVELQKITGIADANYHAVFFAVQDYGDKEIAVLDNPVADAKKLMQVLKDNYGFKDENVRFVENPTRAQMQETFDELQAQLNKNDNLLVFYAGHGIWDEEMQQGFWLPVDAAMHNRSNWFPNNQLRDYIASIKTKHTLLIADACFSGGLFKTRAVADVSPAIQEMYSLQSRRAMTSGALKTVPDKSVFMEYLIRSLENNMEDYIGAMELFNSFRNDVVNNSPNRQVPQFGEIGSTGDQGGDFIFVTKKRK
jgi:DNA-binding beta-propeller fold protein YncE